MKQFVLKYKYPLFLGGIYIWGGGDGGNRTPVHDIETNSSTGVASLMIFSAAVFARSD